MMNAMGQLFDARPLSEVEDVAAST